MATKVKAKSKKPNKNLQEGYNALKESYDSLMGTLCDYRDELFDPETGECWMPIGVGSFDEKQNYQYHTPLGLSIMRNTCRSLATENVFAINLIQNFISYIVGIGCSYSLSPRKKKVVVTEDEADLVKDSMEEFFIANKWPEREQEIVRRGHRDGEAIVRLFFQDDGSTLVRFVHPCDLNNDNTTHNDATLGIQTKPNDVESVTGYIIDKKLVPKEEIFHLKLNVDMDIKRGWSTLWACRNHLVRACKLLRNMSAVIGYQASIAAVRTHENSSSSQVQAFATSRAESTRTDGYGRTSNHKKVKEGTVLDLAKGQTIEFPATGLDVSRVVDAVKAELRAAAACVQMAESMFTSDASNNNMASAIVAEGPSHKRFEREQAAFGNFFVSIITAAMNHKVATHTDIKATYEKTKITCTGATVASRDGLKEAQKNAILFDKDIISRQEWTRQEGKDYTKMQDEIEQDVIRNGPKDETSNSPDDNPDEPEPKE